MIRQVPNIVFTLVMLAALGAWFGWQAIPLIILLSSLVGALLGLTILALTRQGRNTPMPFGPYLAGAGLLALFYGDTLVTQYLQWMTPQDVARGDHWRYW